MALAEKQVKTFSSWVIMPFNVHQQSAHQYFSSMAPRAEGMEKKIWEVLISPLMLSMGKDICDDLLP